MDISNNNNDVPSLQLDVFSSKNQKIFVDASIQTDLPVIFYGQPFAGNKKILRKKAYAICLLTCFKTNLITTSNLINFIPPKYANKKEIDEIKKIALNDDLTTINVSEFNLGIYSLLNLSETDLSEKIGCSKNKKYILIYDKLMKVLIEQTIGTVDEFYDYLYRNVNDKTLSFAIKLAREKQDIRIFEPLSSDDFFLECLASSISIFASNNDKPLEALNTSLRLEVSIPEAKKLITFLTCDFIAASYGTDFIPKDWLITFKDYEDIAYFSKKFVR
jgi:hypothetical protein